MKDFKVKIRSIGPNIINFKQIFPDKQETGPSKHNIYQRMFGFLETQNFISLAYLNEIKQIQKTKKKFKINNLIAYKYPFLNYMDRPPVTLMDIIPSTIVYSFIVFFPLIIKQITAESHNRVRDMFELMGLNDFVYFGSTFLIYFVEFTIQAVVLSIIYTFPFNNNAVFSITSPFLIFLIFLMFGINLILFAILFSIFFNKPSIAIIAGIVTYTFLDIFQVSYFFDHLNV